MNKAKINLMIHETDILSSISKTKKNKEVKLHLFYLSLIFLFFILLITLYIYLIPGLNIEGKKKLKILIPKSFKDLINFNKREKIKILYDSLVSYKNEHGMVLLILLSLLYIFYQSFPIFLWWMTGTASIITILIGAFYNYAFSILYCSILSTISPLIAYAIIVYYGKTVIEHFFKKSLIQFQEKIKKRVKNKLDLFFYIAILRLTPIFPNSLINILGATLSLPIIPFVLATYIGLLPNTIILVSIGQALNRLSSVNMKHQFYVPITFIILLLLFQKIVSSKYKEISL
ncbi:SNARE associated Golgi protein, putative [Plasmodium sp. gorilla clade G2]|uniref:SNARE associated Golgi protein, putative n=1 Tax=Plasmodium sp. gorilla clade G2 TaxID=880535 RepID=UPI000D224682|nr:SNARE associated Golgi protein, putative [Plasmodium sp. gorilla clade G2]SOV12493.1 SNARE associated Golgi protein, putative [Plasmodium sp. gorilla clade G2]